MRTLVFPSNTTQGGKNMTVCSMCRNHFSPANESDLSYIAEDKPICETCSGHLDTVLESKDQNEVLKACSDIYGYYNNSNDPIVKDSIKNFLINHAPSTAIEELAKNAPPKKQSEPVQFSNQTDYFQEKSAENEEGMFGNVSASIKSLTKVFCWIGIIISVICACLIFAANSRYQSTILPGHLCLFLGPFLSWASSLFIYAFADLLDETKKNNRLLTELVKLSKQQNSKKK